MDGSKTYTLPPADPPERGKALHRLGEIRHREGVSRRRVAQLIDVSIAEVENQEDPSSDVQLSVLHRWQKALNVPIAELLIEPNAELSSPVRLRSRLSRIMKTARSIESDARQVVVRRLADMLIEQLVEIMPDLKKTALWSDLDAQPSGMKERFEWHFPFENKWT